MLYDSSTVVCCGLTAGIRSCKKDGATVDELEKIKNKNGKHTNGNVLTNNPNLSRRVDEMSSML